MIRVKGISKTFKVAKRNKGVVSAAKSMFRREYKYIKAVDNIEFAVNRGEIVGYIGPNGAGKSTTIKIMSGILVPDCGECEINGYVPWKNRRQYVSNIGVVFGQRTQLWWDVPIADSFELLKSIYKIPEVKYKESLGLLTETLELTDFMDTPLRQVSLGQRMRAEIAASLLHEPQILFLDEPTIGLDAVSKLAVRKFIKTINEQKKITVILTTHDMNDIEALTNRVILIGKGRILYDGKMQEIKRGFDTYRTVKFIFDENGKETGANIEAENAECIFQSREKAVFKIDTSRATVSEVIAQVSKQVNILDMTSEGCSTEEVIAGLYKEHGI